MVNLDQDDMTKLKKDVEQLKRDGEMPPSPASPANQWPPSPGKDAPAAQTDPIEPPNTLSSDSVGSRLGKSKGERLFERLSAAASASAEANDDTYADTLDDEIDKMLSSKDFVTQDMTDSVVSDEKSGLGGGFDGGVTDPNAPANDAERYAADAAERLFEMLTLDSESAPLPLKSRFARIPETVASRSNVDPFDRLYLGAFGPHGPEVLRVVLGVYLPPRALVVHRVLQTVPVFVPGGVHACVRVPRAPVLVQVLENEQLSIKGGVRARPCTPITVVLSRPLQQPYTPPESSVVAYVFRSFTKKSDDSLVG